MTRKSLLIILLGTRRVKTMTVGASGYGLNQCEQPINRRTNEMGWISFDPLELIYAVRAAIFNVASTENKTGKSIGGIAIVSHDSVPILWDKESGLPLYEGIDRDCLRSEELKRFLKKSYHHDDYLTTGLVAHHNRFASRLKWIVEQYPQIGKKMKSGRHCVGSLESWLVYNLTGRTEHLTDTTNAAQTGLFNIKKLEWDSPLLNETGVEKKMLPKVLPSGHVFGTTKQFVSLADDIPIVGMTHHYQTFFLGQAHNQVGNGFVQLGERATMGLYLGKTKTSQSPRQLLGLECHPMSSGDQETRYVVTSQCPMPSVEMLAPVVNGSDNGKHEVTPKSHSQNTKPVFVVPQEPDVYHMVKNEWAWIGVNREKSVSDFERAVKESVACLTKWGLSRLSEQTRIGIREITVEGVFTKDRALGQYLCDLLQVPLYGVQTDERVIHAVITICGDNMGWQKGKNQRKRVSKDNIAFVPEMDPLSSLALYNRWTGVYKRVSHDRT